MKDVITEFLKPRGLELNEDKTEIKHIREGCDFLGVNIREYPNVTRANNPRKPFKEGIVLTKPAVKSIQNFRQKVKDILKFNKKASAIQLIRKLNPVLKG